MAWDIPMITMLRTLINDLDEANYEFDDVRLKKMLIVAAQYVNHEVDFPTNYTINLVSPDITPDPIDTSDDNFVNLTVLKSACLLTRGSQRVGITQGLVIHDGPSKIDGKQIVIEKRNMADNFCKEYEDAVQQYVLGNAVVGRAIFGPSNIAHPHSHSSSNRSRFT